MAAKKFNLVLLVLFVLLAATASAVTVTTEPNEVIFENVLANGYAEKTIKIISDAPVDVSLSATEPVKSWVSFEPVSASVSEDSPAEFKVVVQPPDAPLGVYHGYIIVNVVSGGNMLSTAIASAFDLRTTIKVTDSEIIQAVIKNVSVKDIEKGSPIKASVTVQNQGNVAVSPFFHVDLLNSDKSQVIKSAISEKKVKKVTLPFSTDVIELDVQNSLDLGTYWAEVTVFLDGGMVAGKHLMRFKVVEQGMLHVEEEPLHIFREEPVPLSLNPFVIVLWGLILLYIVWAVVKKKPEEKE